jgi:hypothetical protein
MVIQWRRELKALQDDNKFRNSMNEGMYCFFTQVADVPKVIEETSTFEQTWYHKIESEQARCYQIGVQSNDEEWGMKRKGIVWAARKMKRHWYKMDFQWTLIITMLLLEWSDIEGNVDLMSYF